MEVCCMEMENLIKNAFCSLWKVKTFNCTLLLVFSILDKKSKKDGNIQTFITCIELNKNELFVLFYTCFCGHLLNLCIA